MLRPQLVHDPSSYIAVVLLHVLQRRKDVLVLLLRAGFVVEAFWFGGVFQNLSTRSASWVYSVISYRNLVLGMAKYPLLRSWVKVASDNAG